MKIQSAAVTLSLFGAVLLFGFQNCSGVNFDATSNTSMKSGVDDSGDGSNIPETPELPDGEDPQNPPGGEDAKVALCEFQLESLMNQNTLVAGETQNLNLENTGLNGHYNQHIVNVTLNKVHGNLKFLSVGVFKANASGGNMGVNAERVDSFSNSHGNISLQADTIKDMSNSGGNFCIRANEINAINDFNGNLIVVDSEIEVMNNFKGNLFLVNSQVKRMSHRIGNIRLINSAVVSETP